MIVNEYSYTQEWRILMSFQMYVPTRILFGEGSLQQLSQIKMPGKKALLLISNGTSAKKNGSLESVEQQLKEHGIDYVIYNGIEANPTKDNVMDASKVARENLCDFILALGGGSVMDASKAIATVATNDGDL